MITSPKNEERLKILKYLATTRMVKYSNLDKIENIIPFADWRDVLTIVKYLTGELNENQSK